MRIVSPQIRRARCVRRVRPSTQSICIAISARPSESPLAPANPCTPASSPSALPWNCLPAEACVGMVLPSAPPLLSAAKKSLLPSIARKAQPTLIFPFLSSSLPLSLSSSPPLSPCTPSLTNGQNPASLPKWSLRDHFPTFAPWKHSLLPPPPYSSLPSP